ncbi:hypothetical protein RchiOBHm_Chr6g0294051 [Rosa chinensis]|uniref:Uncharacterized protein n=1 Tax=Rosa chinensis TaxID=74649 RepID=A0A2P6PWU5_ROSCH|nr:hypothetical protein RchiOBHm_Chr6g0294051 [Rosa chinensis]
MSNPKFQSTPRSPSSIECAYMELNPITAPSLSSFNSSNPFLTSNQENESMPKFFSSGIYDQDPFVQTSLIHMYSACGNLMLACQSV